MPPGGRRLPPSAVNFAAARLRASGATVGTDCDPRFQEDTAPRQASRAMGGEQRGNPVGRRKDSPARAPRFQILLFRVVLARIWAPAAWHGCC
jgi:hypothetical protein